MVYINSRGQIEDKRSLSWSTPLELLLAFFNFLIFFPPNPVVEEMVAEAVEEEVVVGEAEGVVAAVGRRDSLTCEPSVDAVDPTPRPLPADEVKDRVVDW
ncbi:unnamed protein product [Oppiella nova]|uniref:Uncharacterized protein n=1 Tax=Oppiella nova TaxID=334625 RepID=A0A7R9QA74_9ACAR|nr:unnamed protein product [Oppiella nova]CAG2161765.1 unnamed protein product [Oppiella nova]